MLHPVQKVPGRRRFSKLAEIGMMSRRCSNQGTPVTSESVADFVPVHQHLARSAVSKPLEELVLPETPFAPPESDYGDDSSNETTEHLEQFRQEQGRDTFVSASGSSGSSYEIYEAGQMAGYVYGVHGELVAQRLAPVSTNQCKRV